MADIFLIGYTDSFGAGESDVWLIKTDLSGDTLWTKTFGGSSDDWGFSVQQTSDGGYILWDPHLLLVQVRVTFGLF